LAITPQQKRAKRPMDFFCGAQYSYDKYTKWKLSKKNQNPSVSLLSEKKQIGEQQ